MEQSEQARRKVNRRDFLRLGGVVGAATILTACSGAELPAAEPTATLPPTAAAATALPTPPPGPELAVRFAQITDMHIEVGGISRERFSRAMRRLQQLDPPVEFVINTGDCVMDALYANKADAEAQWDVFQSVLSADFPLPVYHAIGNHDVWGWGKSEEQQSAIFSDPLYGKGMAMQRLGLTSRYYSFDKGGWHFIVLDGVHPREIKSEHPYTGKLDEDQLAWLEAELTATDPATPICIASHIPIFGASGLMDSSEASGNWLMPGAWQHIDGRRLIALFWEHRNIQLALSGHTHQIEDLRYHGVKYITSGAISGNWWNGAYHDFPPAFVTVNLYKDGSSEFEIIEY